ncbi:MAG: glycosyltransferase [Lentisphaerae bacterium]|nr:MAG: glycosyltransferase [Lentisphaerota bacterium]
MARSDSIPTLTLITICRNAERTIEQTITSVLHQKQDGVEYIIVDGASRDATMEIITRYESMIDTVISEPDAGIADAFNKGLALANGEIIGLINADDQLAPGTVEFVRSFFHSRSDVEVLHGDVLLYDGDRFIKRLRPSGCWWHPLRLVLFNHPATFVRKHVYERLGGFCDRYRIAMDVEMFLRWQSAGMTIHYVPHPLAIMQIGGISSAEAVAGYRECRQALIEHGFPASVAHVQYWSKRLVNAAVSICRRFLPRI